MPHKLKKYEVRFLHADAVTEESLTKGIASLDAEDPALFAATPLPGDTVIFPLPTNECAAFLVEGRSILYLPDRIQMDIVVSYSGLVQSSEVEPVV